MGHVLTLLGAPSTWAPLLGVPLLLSGCAGLVDPFQRAGTFQLDSVNDDNLRAMAVYPDDLREGRPVPNTLGVDAVAGVTRYRAGAVKQLPDSNLSSVGGGAGSGGQGSGGGTTGGAGQ
jgi:hypothetical protein